jgi:hypothetical protein
VSVLTWCSVSQIWLVTVATLDLASGNHAASPGDFRVASRLLPCPVTDDSTTNALHLFLLFHLHAFPVAPNALGPPAPPSSMTFHEFVLHTQPTRSIPPS